MLRQKKAAYSAASTYALGKVVFYVSAFYTCTTAITVPEAWNAALESAKQQLDQEWHWLMDELKAV